jgi:hypothetical protein
MGEGATAIAAGVHDEEVEAVGRGNVTEVWVISEGVNESHPRLKETGTVGSGRSHDAVAGFCRRSTEISVECITVRRRHERQGISCGK